MPIFLLLGLAFAVLVIVVAAVSAKHRLGSRSFQTLHELSSEVSRIIGLPSDRDPEGWFRRLDQLSFSGALPGGRRAKVEFFSESVGSSTTTYVRFFVAVEGAPHLLIRPEGYFDKIGKVLGFIREVEIGVADFDGRYILDARTAPPVKKLLSEEMRDLIDRAFEKASPRAVRFEPKGIVVEVRAAALEPDLYPAVLSTLVAAAALIDARRVRVRVLGGTRRLVVGPRGGPRCAYCRADVTGQEPDLVACERCSTVVHAACWDDHGRCPIYGCEGSSAERGRERESAR